MIGITYKIFYSDNTVEITVWNDNEFWFQTDNFFYEKGIIHGKDFNELKDVEQHLWE